MRLYVSPLTATEPLHITNTPRNMNAIKKPYTAFMGVYPWLNMPLHIMPAANRHSPKNTGVHLNVPLLTALTMRYTPAAANTPTPTPICASTAG